jgi:cytochrome c
MTRPAACPPTARRHALVTPLAGLLMLLAPTANAAADLTADQQLFGRCASCHSTVAGGNRIGPSLAGIVSRKSGVDPGALKKA